MNVTVNAQGVLTTLDTSKAPPVDLIIAYEAGELSEEDVIDLFQHGIDNGWVWSLQGAYGRQAERLINCGLCTPAGAPATSALDASGSIGYASSSSTVNPKEHQTVTTTIYVAPGESQCRVYAIPYAMRPGQHPRDIDYRYQREWPEIGLLNHKLDLVCVDPAYAHLADDIRGQMGGTYFEIGG